MDFISDEELIAAWDAAQRAAVGRRRKFGFLGDRQRSDPFTVPGRKGFIWMRPLEGTQIGHPIAVLNAGTNAVQKRYDLAVIAELNEDDIYEIRGTWTRRALERYQDTLSTVAQAEQVSEASGVLVAGKNIKPGRLVLVDAALPLRVSLSPFEYKDSAGDRKEFRGYVASDSTTYIDLTAPASNTERWTLIEFNPDATTPTLVATNGTARTLAFPQNDTTDIDALTFTNGREPMWAVKMKTAQAAVNFDTGIKDLRQWLSGSSSGGASKALDNLASVAINTTLVSDTDSTDDLGTTARYWRNGYIDTLYLTEQSAPSTPAADKGVVYPKTDGKLYFKNQGGTEYDLTAGSGTTDTIGAFVSLRDEKSSGTQGGTLTSGSFQRRDLNVKAADTGTNCSITQVAFTSGGTYEIVAGDTITGATSGATATVFDVVLTSGSWAGGDAAGVLWLNGQSGTFSAENLNVGANSNVATIAANSSSNGQFRLKSGTWRIHASAPAYYCDHHKAQLYNDTDAASVIIGTAEYSTNGLADSCVTRSVITGRFTIAANKTLSITHRPSSTRATDGCGVANSFSVVEVYTTVDLTKEP